VSDDGFRAASRRGGAYRLGQPVEVALATVDERLKRIDFFLPGALRPGRHKHIDKQRGKVRNKRSKHPERSGASRRPTK
jgi:hypothetical protein